MTLGHAAEVLRWPWSRGKALSNQASTSALAIPRDQDDFEIFPS